MRIVLLLLVLLFCFGLSCRQTAKELKMLSLQKDVTLYAKSTPLHSTAPADILRS